MISELKFKFLENEIVYDGRQLKTHFGLEKTGIFGSLVLAFIGKCEVQTSELVDWEDRLNSDFIRAKKMLHFVGEFYGTSLESTVLYQRLFMDHARKILSKYSAFQKIKRNGDDLMVGEQKLSVSIATASPVSTLIHWGINIDSKGAPIATIGLNVLDWNQNQIQQFSKELFENFANEVCDIQKACMKVKPVL